MLLLVIFAFLAGIVTILSPCILPILPLILSVPATSTTSDRHRPYGVIVGFVSSFTFFTLFLTSIVKSLGVSADLLKLISVVVIFFFGLTLIFSFFQKLIERLFGLLSSYLPNSPNRMGFGGGVILGLSLGLLWTPCVGPILASVISLALIGRVTFDAFLITLAYSIGTAIPMYLVIKLGTTLFTKLPGLKRNSVTIQKIFGIIMLLTALAIYQGYDRRFQTYVLDKFPNYGAGLTKFESNLKEVKVDINQKGASTPDLTVGGKWFNLPPGVQNYHMSDLKGKVVLIDFWTYSCINCIRTLPYLKSWWEKYKDDGLVIIGVHTPEFEFEKNSDNVCKALKDFGITYPVMQDNDFATWRAYDNHYWPAKYFVDKDGKVRSSHFGEGDYDESEKIIQELLKETGKAVDMPINNSTYLVQTRTPETYLGYARIEGLASPEFIGRDKEQLYSLPKSLSNNSFGFKGSWTVTKEYAEAGKESSLEYAYEAKSVYLVMNPVEGGGKVEVYLDGVKVKDVEVNADQLYTLVDLPDPGRHILRLVFPDGHVRAYAFTFG